MTTRLTPSDLRISYTGGPGSWRGIIKRGKEIVWRCSHTHPNRDEDAAHTAARPCASAVLDALLDPERFQRTTEAMERAGCGVGGPLAAECARRFAWNLERRRWAMEQAEVLRSGLATTTTGVHP